MTTSQQAQDGTQDGMFLVEALSLPTCTLLHICASCLLFKSVGNVEILKATGCCGKPPSSQLPTFFSETRVQLFLRYNYCDLLYVILVPVHDKRSAPR